MPCLIQPSVTTEQSGTIGAEDNKICLLTMDAIRTLRINRGESQSRFWKRFGVSQSSGSRFERGIEVMPDSVAILVKLYWDGIVSEGDLKRARQRRQAIPDEPQSRWTNPS